MNPDHMLTQRGTLYVREPGGPDEYGDAVPPVVTALADVACLLQQNSATEAEATDAAVQVTRWRLFLTAGVGAMRGWDGIEVDGAMYEALGDAWPVYNPRTGDVSHLEATVQRAE